MYFCCRPADLSRGRIRLHRIIDAGSVPESHYSFGAEGTDLATIAFNDNRSQIFQSPVAVPSSPRPELPDKRSNEMVFLLVYICRALCF